MRRYSSRMRLADMKSVQAFFVLDVAGVALCAVRRAVIPFDGKLTVGEWSRPCLNHPPLTAPDASAFRAVGDS